MLIILTKNWKSPSSFDSALTLSYLIYIYIYTYIRVCVCVRIYIYIYIYNYMIVLYKHIVKVVWCLLVSRLCNHQTKSYFDDCIDETLTVKKPLLAMKQCYFNLHIFVVLSIFINLKNFIIHKHTYTPTHTHIHTYIYIYIF